MDRFAVRQIDDKINTEVDSSPTDGHTPVDNIFIASSHSLLSLIIDLLLSVHGNLDFLWKSLAQ
jgi:hypothetical protein